jgi:N-acetylglucosaminyldiphosphoundecaprenol N-acetyl-beta-D-mannosaminyltransferase
MRQPIHLDSVGKTDSSAGTGGGIAVKRDLCILGVPFWNPTYEEFNCWWQQALSDDAGGCKSVFIANAHTLNIACTSKEYTDCLERADVLVNDGFGYRIASRLRGHETRYNFNGTDLFPRLFGELKGPLKVFLYGADEESNEGTAKRLAADFPFVKVVGRLHGYGTEEDAVEAINACTPDPLLCALGQPKQEIFMLRWADRLKVKIQVGVGGLFDFLSGSKSRAPKLMRDIGFEWLYRLGQEPRRLFRRYVIGNPLFLVRCLIYLRRDNRLTAALCEQCRASDGQSVNAGVPPAR